MQKSVNCSATPVPVALTPTAMLESVTASRPTSTAPVPGGSTSSRTAAATATATAPTAPVPPDLGATVQGELAASVPDHCFGHRQLQSVAAPCVSIKGSGGRARSVGNATYNFDKATNVPVLAGAGRCRSRMKPPRASAVSVLPLASRPRTESNNTGNRNNGTSADSAL
jgi:hypothetical protein